MKSLVGEHARMCYDVDPAERVSRRFGADTRRPETRELDELIRSRSRDNQVLVIGQRRDSDGDVLRELSPVSVHSHETFLD